ncbi:hypothetical protein CC78DRAFT_591815 [Lojkania enalia]|uniref:Uncharacterized protein n=1 Tax=Lojkania enalia TaxID=147567 RepID=A0A9P4K0A4_9PLEO|nr:hypothetical protein CC78DRAFT_591815 [Didymosphaeria enalia]
MDTDAAEQVPDNLQTDIVNSLWQRNKVTLSQTPPQEWEAYFHYYHKECKTWIGYGHGEYAFVRIHEDITDIAKKLDNGDTKAQIKDSLLRKDTQNRTVDEKIRMAEGSMRLVVPLSAMIDIGRFLAAISIQTTRGTTRKLV